MCYVGIVVTQRSRINKLIGSLLISRSMVRIHQGSPLQTPQYIVVSSARPIDCQSVVRPRGNEGARLWQKTTLNRHLTSYDMIWNQSEESGPPVLDTCFMQNARPPYGHGIAPPGQWPLVGESVAGVGFDDCPVAIYVNQLGANP